MNIKKQLQKYEHIQIWPLLMKTVRNPQWHLLFTKFYTIWQPLQDIPHPAPAKTNGQDPIPEDNTKVCSKETKKLAQQVVGNMTYYAWNVDITLLMALSAIAAEQSKTTEFWMDKVQKLLYYCAIHPNAKIRYK